MEPFRVNLDMVHEVYILWDLPHTPIPTNDPGISAIEAPGTVPPIG